VLRDVGLSSAQVEDARKLLLSLPHVHITEVRAFVEEEEDIKEGDHLTVRAHIAITRAAGGRPGICAAFSSSCYREMARFYRLLIMINIPPEQVAFSGGRPCNAQFESCGLSRRKYERSITYRSLA
jgi:hypothetical protein